MAQSQRNRRSRRPGTERRPRRPQPRDHRPDPDELVDRGRSILKRVYAGMAVMATLGGVVAVGAFVYDRTLKPDPCPEFQEVPASVPGSQVTVSPRDVRAVLRDYSRAYSRRDINSMKSLLSSNHCRYGSSGPRTRDKTLAEYQRQFNEQKRDTRYKLKLEPLVAGDGAKAVTPGHGEASAEGHYRISYHGQDLGTGAVKFHLVESHGALRIDQVKFP
jgi:hypothetical protein